MKPNKKEERRKAIARITLRYLSKRSIFLAVVYYRFFRYVVKKVWKRRSMIKEKLGVEKNNEEWKA